MPNSEKQQRYAFLMGRLKRALSAEFWFEACMLEYAIFEDRTSSILYYAGVFPREEAFSEKKMLKNKLNSIRYQIGKGHPILSKKVSDETLAEIDAWRNQRNDAVHRACTHPGLEAEIRDIALRGKTLVDRLCSESRKVTRLSEKLGVCLPKEKTTSVIAD